MPTNITRKEQKDKWLALHKAAFVEELLDEKPRDYQERNWFYRLASILISYPLQVISILAGSYLLYDVFRYVWQLEFYSRSGLLIFVICVFIFLSVETLRRWLVNSTGDYYVRSFKIVDGKLKKGEWLRSNLYSLAFISLLLVSTGTIGVYQYIKHNSPEQATIDLAQVSQPQQQDIKEEKAQIKHLDQRIDELMQAKKRELADARSYAIWMGKEYLLPEVKQRHSNYDKQLNEMHSQREKHLARLEQQEQRLAQTEHKTEIQNAQISQNNHQNKELYASVSASVWLSFEFLLVFMLAYTWLFKYYAKREKLLELLAENPELKSHYRELMNKGNGQDNLFRPHLNEAEKVQNEGLYPTQTVGFRQKPQPNTTVENKTERETEVIVKEVEVPVIREVIIEKAKAKPKSKEGFTINCAHCGETVTKKRPAKYCSASCRNKAWKEAKGIA